MREAPAPPERKPLSTFELVAMVAALSALNAVAIDIMLPALPDIGRAFALTNDNDRQLVIVVYMLAFGVAQLLYGPLADAFGRRSVLNIALGLFIIGAVLCVIAPSFDVFLAARVLQGLGAAATRVIATAVVRDLVSGRRMAQIMSMAMTLFMIVPIIAPGLGQLILFVAPWRWIFAALLIYALGVLLWIGLRLPETLTDENRTPFRAPEIAGAYGFILMQRQTFGYMAATTFMSACIMAYVTASEQLYVEVYAMGAAFPLAFAAVAIVMSAGTFLNSRLVMRFGMRRISHTVMFVFTLIALAHLLMLAAGVRALAVFLPMMMLNFACIGLMGGNFNALAMEPVGRVAGSASALFGAVTALGGGLIGGLLAHQFDGTALPFVLGLAALGACIIASVLWTERLRLFRDPVSG